MGLKMVNKSIFSFLEDYDVFKNILDECYGMEIEIKHECYYGAARTGRTISELLIKTIAKTHEDYLYYFFHEDRWGNLRWNDLVKIIQMCYDEDLIDYDIYQEYDDIRKWGNNWSHGNNYKFDVKKDALKIHKKIFTLCKDCYKRFDKDNLKNYDDKYELNLDYLDKNDKFTHEQLIEHLQNINKDEFQIEELQDYINSKKIFIPIKLFNELTSEYITKVKNLDIFEDTFKGLKFITDDDQELIMDNFNEEDANQIINNLKKQTNNQFEKVNNFLNEYEEEVITMDKLDSLINLNEDDNTFKLIKSLAVSLSKDVLSDIRDELNNIPVSKIDKNNRYVVEFPRLELFEEDDKIYLKESEEKIQLDKDQREAVQYTGEKLVINAGPGSGKTRVIIERVVYLIEELGIHPSTILVITFTRKATQELRERFKNDTELSINDINQMRISTIHSFCRFLISKYEEIPYNYLLRTGERGLFISNNKRQLGFIQESFIYPNHVKHISEAYNDYFNFRLDKEKLIEYILNKYPVKEDYFSFIQDYFKDKSPIVSPPYNYVKSNGYAQDWFFTLYHQVAESYDLYKEVLDNKNACDNNHLLEKANEILENDYILNNLQYTNILIDEFQDTDYNQKELFDKLLTITNTFTIVGDADQSIYEWRGASQEFFNEYATRDDFKLITLHNNYRSTKDIVEFNEELIKNHRKIPKEIKSKDKKYTLPVYHLTNYNNDEEVDNITNIIKTLKKDKKIKYYSDIVLLFRSNYGIENMIKSLENAGIDYYLKDKKDFGDQDEVKAILTLLWYLIPYKKFNYKPGFEDYLNLYGFTDEKYKSSKIFKLSEKTMKALAKIQEKYDRKLLMLGRKKVPYGNRKSRDGLYWAIFNELSDEDLSSIFNEVETYDIAELDEEGLNKIGITDDHDVNFFLNLNELKSQINDKSLKPYEKLSTLDVFYKLLNITDYYDEINIQRNKVSKKIKSNLALISEVIYDYERIVGKYYYSGLFNYLSSVLPSYSCPIHDMEDNLNKVHIMTVHKSKGLEYPIVILGSLRRGVNTDIDGNQKFKTPIECLKNKPDLDYEEQDNKYEEEMRVIYVATTRAEELLILSSVDENKTPIFLEDIKQNFNRVRDLDPRNLNSIPKIKSSGKKKEVTNFPELNFDEIMRDYLLCPYHYDISNNFKFRTDFNDDSFLEMRMRSVLNKLFTKKEVTNEYMDKLIKKTKDSYNIKEGSETAQILNKIPAFWNESGKYYDVLEDAMDINVSMVLEYCDLNGMIDLIVKEDDNNISIVKFFGTDRFIERFKSLYKDYYQYYAYILSELEISEDYNIKNIILHSIKNNKTYTFEYNEKKKKRILKRLNKITKEIVYEDYKKITNNCGSCEFKDNPCKG